MARGVDRIERGAICLYRFQPPDKQRPVLVVTRSSVLRFLTRVTVVPITSTVRGNASELLLGTEDGMKGPCAANFDGLATVHRAGLIRVVARLRPERMPEICTALNFALGCLGPAD